MSRIQIRAQSLFNRFGWGCSPVFAWGVVLRLSLGKPPSARLLWEKTLCMLIRPYMEKAVPWEYDKNPPLVRFCCMGNCTKGPLRLCPLENGRVTKNCSFSIFWCCSLIGCISMQQTLRHKAAGMHSHILLHSMHPEPPALLSLKQNKTNLKNNFEWTWEEAIILHSRQQFLSHA